MTIISRRRTSDRGPPGQIEILTVEQLGPNRSLTANGNLVCKDVPIARVGWLIYGPGEVPVEVDPETGYSRVYRSEETLFSPETIGSFMGVAVTDEHPDDDVNPENWKKLAQGFTTTNVRRGEGPDADVLLADLIITDKKLIDSVNEGKREVSAGYEADYKQTGPGTGEQTNIIGNHIALVEKGRCGPRCAIGDQAYQVPQPTTKDDTMTTRVKLSAIESRAQQREADRRAKLRQFFKDAEGLLEETADPGMDDTDTDTGGTHIHIHTNGTSGQGDPDPSPGGMPDTMSRDEGEGGQDPIESRFQAIEQSIEQLAGSVAQLAEAVGGKQAAPAGDADPDAQDPPPDDETRDELPDDLKDDDEAKGVKTGDSAALATGFARLMSEVEILVPGFRVPTFDAKAKRTKTIDQMCNVRRQALTSCYSTVAGKQLIDSVSGKQDLDLSGLGCGAVASIFTASVGAKRLLNNRSNTSDQAPNHGGQVPNGAHASASKSIADWNKANAEFWAKQGIAN